MTRGELISLAWRNWLASEEGKSCASGEATGQYLENRLHRAFTAGADYLDSCPAKEAIGKRRKGERRRPL